MNSTQKNVEEFIKTMVLPEYRPLVEAFRTLVKRDFPELKEEMRGGSEKYYGVPVYRLNRIVMTVSPTKQGVTFSFSEGKSFDDKYRLLEGVGNKSLNIRMKKIDEFDEEMMRYYIRQAIAIDQKG